MKFSWKICVSVLAFTLLVTGIGGYALLSALFQSSWQREVKNAAEENRMLQYSFAAYWSTTARERNSGYLETDVRRAAQAMKERMTGTELSFRIYSQDGTELYASESGELLGEDDRQRLHGAVSEDTSGRILVRSGESYELVTASGILMEDGTVLCLESGRDVTALFADRENQYAIYRRWMAGLLLLEGLGCYLIAVWLLRPLRRLSRAARRLAGGSLEVRARVETEDEVGQLAADFNHMADSLERQFKELEDAARRQEDFIGSFAHELKTPLTSMIGYADMLRTREMRQEERFEAANYIFREGKRLEALSFKLLYLLGRREAGGFAFYVRDTGKGIPKKELSRITEAFYMVDKSRARRQGGAGLGLSICAEIVKQHGGKLSFQSMEGKGTYARVWLPDGQEE